jgi:integrase
MLKTFCTWAVKLGEMETNPFDEIRPAKDAGLRSTKRDSFSLDEVHRILQTFRLHPLYFRYHDFVLMLMTFGLRPSEAIGLQWKDINFTQRTITIAESLSRTGEGSRRARRGRKNGTITALNLPDEIYTMLEGRFNPTAKPNNLIFTSPTGKPIDDGNFAQRIWKPLLKQAGIPHRPPYNCRHSMASHAIDQGLTLPETAYLLGHKDTTMVSKVYGHMVNRPQVPKLTL